MPYSPLWLLRTVDRLQPSKHNRQIQVSKCLTSVFQRRCHGDMRESRVARLERSCYAPLVGLRASLAMNHERVAKCEFLWNHSTFELPMGWKLLLQFIIHACQLINRDLKKAAEGRWEVSVWFLAFPSLTETSSTFVASSSRNCILAMETKPTAANLPNEDPVFIVSYEKLNIATGLGQPMMMKHPYHRPVLKFLCCCPERGSSTSSCRETRCTTNLGFFLPAMNVWIASEFMILMLVSSLFENFIFIEWHHLLASSRMPAVDLLVASQCENLAQKKGAFYLEDVRRA